MRVYQFRHVGTVTALLLSATYAATEARIIGERRIGVKSEMLIFDKDCT